MHKNDKKRKKKRKTELKRITRDSKRVLRKYAHSKNIYVELAQEMAEKDELDE